RCVQIYFHPIPPEATLNVRRLRHSKNLWQHFTRLIFFRYRAANGAALPYRAAPDAQDAAAASQPFFGHPPRQVASAGCQRAYAARPAGFRRYPPLAVEEFVLRTLIDSNRPSPPGLNSGTGNPRPSEPPSAHPRAPVRRLLILNLHAQTPAPLFPATGFSRSASVPVPLAWRNSGTSPDCAPWSQR